MIDLQPSQGGEHRADGAIEFFFYVLSGALTLTVDGRREDLKEGGYALLPPASSFQAKAAAATSLLVLRKRYEPAPGIPLHGPLAGNQGKVPGTVYAGDPGALLQCLLPDEISYDLAMNIFTFEVGHSLPVTETHVMEHGLFVLQGKGTYFLDDTWMEVEATDFIWMGPYCPQSYYATGLVPSRYIYYKNVNREIPL
jgi:(S)-ureidoglycine aminohydrolase